MTYISETDRINGYIRIVLKDAISCVKCGGRPLIQTTDGAANDIYADVIRARMKCTVCDNHTVHYTIHRRRGIKDIYYIVTAMADQWNMINKPEEIYNLPVHLL